MCTQEESLPLNEGDLYLNVMSQSELTTVELFLFQETNRDLNRRVTELNKINESLKDKLKQV